MNIKRIRPEIKKSRLENEVILAVVILYVLLSAVLLGIHQMQPPEMETQTSSTSPAHGEFSVAAPAAVATVPAPAPAPMNLAQANNLLVRRGYQEIKSLRAGGSGFLASALKQGKSWEVEVDAASHEITRTPKPVR